MPHATLSECSLAVRLLESFICTSVNIYVPVCFAMVSVPQGSCTSTFWPLILKLF